MCRSTGFCSETKCLCLLNQSLIEEGERSLCCYPTVFVFCPDWIESKKFTSRFPFRQQLSFLTRPVTWPKDNSLAFGTGSRGLLAGPVKLDAVLPTACHRCSISLKGVLLPTGTMTQYGSANQTSKRAD